MDMEFKDNQRRRKLALILGVLLAVGATALVAGGVMFLLGQPEAPTIAVVPGPHGAGVVVTGVWP